MTVVYISLFLGFTSIPQIGQVVVQSINHPKTQGKEVYFAAQLNVATLNEIIAIKEKTVGKPFTKSFVSIEDTEKKLAANGKPWDDFGTYLRLWQAKGFAVSPNNLAGEFKIEKIPLDKLFA